MKKSLPFLFTPLIICPLAANTCHMTHATGRRERHRGAVRALSKGPTPRRSLRPLHPHRETNIGNDSAGCAEPRQPPRQPLCAECTRTLSRLPTGPPMAMADTSDPVPMDRNRICGCRTMGERRRARGEGRGERGTRWCVRLAGRPGNQRPTPHRSGTQAHNSPACVVSGTAGQGLPPTDEPDYAHEYNAATYRWGSSLGLEAGHRPRVVSHHHAVLRAPQQPKWKGRIAHGGDRAQEGGGRD